MLISTPSAEIALWAGGACIRSQRVARELTDSKISRSRGGDREASKGKGAEDVDEMHFDDLVTVKR